MKQNATLQKESFSPKQRGDISVNQKLDNIFEQDRNTTFIKKKMEEARRFLDQNGLPKGFPEWKK